MRGRETKKDGGAGKRWREVQGGREIHGEGKNYREGEGHGGKEGRMVLRDHLILKYESVMTQVGISDPTCTMTMCVRHGMQIYQSLYTYKSS